MKTTLKITKDFTKEFNAVIRKFKNDKVLVGIPEDKSERNDDEASGEQVTNAMLLAMLNFGSPINNIPPWPVMSMGIRQAQPRIAEQFKKCAKDTLHAAIHGGSGFDILDRYYTRAGIIASTSIKKVINSQEDAPALSDRTIYAREHRKPTPFKGKSRGIVTGQMRNAITYVVRGKD